MNVSERNCCRVPETCVASRRLRYRSNMDMFGSRLASQSG